MEIILLTERGNAMTYAIKRPDKTYLTIEDAWIDLEAGLKSDTIRGYTEFDLAKMDAQNKDAFVVPHPWPAGEQRELFPLWAELGPDGSMKGDTNETQT